MSYTGQSEPNINEDTRALELLRLREAESHAQDPTLLSPTSHPQISPSLPSTIASPLPSPPATDHSTGPLNTIAGTTSRNRPATDGKAFPFKLSLPLHGGGDFNASTLTLKSVGLASPMPEEGLEKRLGEGSTSTPINGPGAGDGAGDAEPGAKRPEIERFETAKSSL